MSSIVGAKAISLASTPGSVEERPHARVFAVLGTGGESYTVVIGWAPIDTPPVLARDVCTCRAGQRGVKCSHTAAAHILIARERREA